MSMTVVLIKRCSQLFFVADEPILLPSKASFMTQNCLGMSEVENKAPLNEII